MDHVNLLDRLEALAGEASDRPWRSVQPYASIVTDGASLAHMDEDNRRAYGGGLVGESIHPADRDFIVAAVNVLPDLLAAVRALAELTRRASDPDVEATATGARIMLQAALEDAHAALEPFR